MADKRERKQPVVLILKAKNDDDIYERLFNENGYETVFLPVLAFKFINQESLSERLKKTEKYNGLVFTSQRGVDAIDLVIKDTEFEESWRTLLEEKWSQLPIFVTGKATGRQVREKLQFSLVFGEDSGSAEALVEVILKTLPLCSGKELLFPCANIKKEVLPTILKEKGYGVSCITAYCTQPDPNLVGSLQKMFGTDSGAECKRELGAIEQPECIVFFSPSGVNFSLDPLQQILKSLEDIKLVAIGQSTAQELQKHNLTVSGVPLKPDPHSLLKVINSIFNST